MKKLSAIAFISVFLLSLISILLLHTKAVSANSFPIIAEDIRNSEHTPILRSVSECLPPTPATYEEPYRFSLFVAADDPEAEGDSNPHRPVRYLYIHVFDSPTSNEPWQTLIGIKRDGSCQNYIAQQAFISLTNYMPFPMAKFFASKWYDYAANVMYPPADQFFSRVRDLVENGRIRLEEGQLDVEPCQLLPERFAALAERGINVNRSLCEVLPVARQPFWAR